jgi:hypothetical protein
MAQCCFHKSTPLGPILKQAELNAHSWNDIYSIFLMQIGINFFTTVKVKVAL